MGSEILLLHSLRCHKSFHKKYPGFKFCFRYNKISDLSHVIYQPIAISMRVVSQELGRATYVAILNNSISHVLVIIKLDSDI